MVIRSSKHSIHAHFEHIIDIQIQAPNHNAGNIRAVMRINADLSCSPCFTNFFLLPFVSFSRNERMNKMCASVSISFGAHRFTCTPKTFVIYGSVQ